MDIVYVKGLIEKILQKAHTLPIKQTVDDRKGDRFVFACPYCGDSDKNPAEKRGNLHFDTWHYKCYNGGCGKWTYLDDMIKDFMSDMKPIEKIKLFEELNAIKKENKVIQENRVFQNKLSDYLNKFVNLKDMTDVMENTRSIFTNFKPVNPKSDVGNYLSGRRIKLNDNFYEADFWYSDEASYSQRVLVILNRSGERVIGMQLRFLDKKAKIRYRTFTFTELFKIVYYEDLSKDESFVYDRIGYIFNILNVDFSRPVTVFEGYLDSTFIPNSVGMTGTNTDVHFLSEQGITFRFFFDFDNAGHIETEKYLKEGNIVFLWGRFLEYLTKEYKTLPEVVRNFKSDKQDLNKWVVSPFYTDKIDLEKCFSKDKLDILYTIKPIKEKRPFIKK